MHSRMMFGNRCMMKLISGSNLSKQKELLLWEEINQVQFLKVNMMILFVQIYDLMILLKKSNFSRRLGIFLRLKSVSYLNGEETYAVLF